MAKEEFRSESPATMTRSAPVEHQSLDSPKTTKMPPHGRIELVDVGDTTIGRTRFEPGWKWSTDVKPQAGTDSCQLLHRIYMVSGRMAIRMEDGSELEIGPGEAAYIPPGHDAWVVGNEAVENISFSHAGNPDVMDDKSKD
ncbi:MAG TPA: cupin domain-containing protein [Stenomitos sp.]